MPRSRRADQRHPRSWIGAAERARLEEIEWLAACPIYVVGDVAVTIGDVFPAEVQAARESRQPAGELALRILKLRGGRIEPRDVTPRRDLPRALA